MSLYFRNSTQNIVNVALGHPSEICDGGIRVLGWWPISPGDTRETYKLSPWGKTIYYFATDLLGTYWAGPEIYTHIILDRFDYCYGTQVCEDCEHVGFRALSLPAVAFIDDFTLEFVP